MSRPREPGGEAPASPRRYGGAIGILGLVLVIAISVYQFARNGTGTAGVPPGHRIHFFAAPVAASSLRGDANLRRPCALARFGAQAVNTCLLVRRAPLVLGFFVTGSKDCRRQIDVMQAVAAEFSASAVQFAAVAVSAGAAETARLVRAHGWTIPVAYDADGAVGQLYGVAVCPMVELVARGGIVRERLLGDHWLTSAALASRVRALVAQ